jgi:hypothetical protein
MTTLYGREGGAQPQALYDVPPTRLAWYSEKHTPNGWTQSCQARRAHLPLTAHISRIP